MCNSVANTKMVKGILERCYIIENKMVDETQEDHILQATVQLLQVFPGAELTIFMDAVTRAASVSGERAYDILVEQAVDIYLEAEQGISKEETDCSPVDYSMTPLLNLQPQSSLEHPEGLLKSTISTKKTEITSDLQENIVSTINPSTNISISDTKTGSGETSMDLGTSRTTSETITSITGKRPHGKTGLESPPRVPSKKANLESMSSEMDTDNEWPVLTPSNSSSTPRKKVQTCLNPSNGSEKKVDFIDLTDDVVVVGSAGSFADTDRKRGAVNLQEVLTSKLNVPGPSVVATLTTADFNSVFTGSPLQSLRTDAQCQTSPGSFQTQKGTYPEVVDTTNSSPCETIGKLEISSSTREHESTSDPGSTSPYDAIPSVQGLLELLSTEIANQESKQNDTPMPEISVGQNTAGNYFGSGHLQSIANYFLGKMKQFSSAQSPNAEMNPMNKSCLTTESDSLQSGNAENLARSPTIRPSSSLAADERGADRGPIASSSATSKSVMNGKGATGYRNYRATNMDTDEDITHTNNRLMLKSTNYFEADWSAFLDDPDVMECSVCTTTSAVHKCVSCYAGHFLCKHCVAEEVQSVILSKQKICLLCPAKSCTELLSLSSLELVVDEFLLELLRKNLEHKEKKISLKAINAMEGLVSCPGCNYTGLLDNEEYEFVCGNNNCPVRCCRYCKSEWTNKDDHLGCYLLSSVGTECFNDMTVLPHNWQKTDNAGKAFYMKTETSSLEGLGWNEFFKKTNPTVRIVRLWRIQNRKLWERYVVKRKHMVEELRLENIHEKALFHGTRYANINLIANEGFDFRVQTVNGNKWGKGIYFSNSAAYSQTFSCESKYMFIARVLCGQSTYGNQSLTRPPHSSSGRMFDSCVDNPKSPTMYTVFDNTQCYPEILLQFN